MTDEEAIERRLAAVERALSAGRQGPDHLDGSGPIVASTHPVATDTTSADAASGDATSADAASSDTATPPNTAGPPDTATPPDTAATPDGDPALAERVAALEADATGLQQRVADLDAAVQALRGYVGNVRHVNRTVERRAEAALAAAERAEGMEPSDRADSSDPD